MFLGATLLWVAGLVTIVPYGTYYLLFHAERDQYAFLITLVLFWIFGYWGVVGPLLGAIKVRRVFRALEHAHAEGRLREALQSADAQDAAVELIATENRIPRFLARRVYRLLVRGLSMQRAAPEGAVGGPASTSESAD